MSKQVIRPTGMLNSPGYSHAVIKQGTPVFISGQVAQDGAGAIVGEDDIGEQVAQVFRNLRTVVNACGGSMDDIVKINVYTTDLAHRPAISEARMQQFRAGFMPASTFVVVSSLADPRLMVEIEAVAVI